MKIFTQAILAAIYFVVTSNALAGPPAYQQQAQQISEKQKAIMTLSAVIDSKMYDIPAPEAEALFLKNVKNGIHKVEDENRKTIAAMPEDEQVAYFVDAMTYAQNSGDQQLEEKLNKIRNDESLTTAEKLTKIKNDEYSTKVLSLARDSVKTSGSVTNLLQETKYRYETDEARRPYENPTWKEQMAELSVKDMVIDGVIAIAVIGVLLGGGAPILGALVAVGSVILGSLAAALLCALFQKGKYIKNVEHAFHINMRISMSFLGLSALAGIIWGGGLIAAGGNGVNGYVVGNHALSWARNGNITIGSSSYINGKNQMDIIPHERGHSVQFLMLSLVFGYFGPYAVWGSYLTMGVLGNFKIGKFWEENAGMFGGYGKPVTWLTK